MFNHPRDSNFNPFDNSDRNKTTADSVLSTIVAHPARIVASMVVFKAARWIGFSLLSTPLFVAAALLAELGNWGTTTRERTHERFWINTPTKTEPLNLLFICSRNRWRSPTAEQVWKNVAGLDVRSRGTSSKAERTVKIGDIRWADPVFVMETKHKGQLQLFVE